MNIGALIKESRLKHNYTQDELAAVIGVKKSSIAKWENGSISEIKRSNLKKLSDVLEIDPNILLGKTYSNQDEIVLRNKIEQKLILAYRNADSEHQKLVKIVLGMEETK